MAHSSGRGSSCGRRRCLRRRHRPIRGHSAAGASSASVGDDYPVGERVVALTDTRIGARTLGEYWQMDDRPRRRVPDRRRARRPRCGVRRRTRGRPAEVIPLHVKDVLASTIEPSLRRSSPIPPARPCSPPSSTSQRRLDRSKRGCRSSWRAPDQDAGGMFWFRRNRFFGSHFFLSRRSRSYFFDPNAASTLAWPSSPRKFRYAPPVDHGFMAPAMSFV
jgi:hypothetical protein